MKEPTETRNVSRSSGAWNGWQGLTRSGMVTSSGQPTNVERIRRNWRMGDGMDMCYSVKVVEYKAASNQEAEKTVNKFTDVV